MASPEELLEQIRQKSQQPNALGFTGGQLGMGAGQGVLPETTNPFAVQTGVTPQAPVVGPTIASEQPAIPQMTPELAAQREEARGPMEDSSFFGNIGSVFGSPQESVVPRGGVRTRGTGGSVNPEAEARTGGIAGADELLGFTEAVQGIVNPSEEQKAANLAAGRTGGIQALPEPQVAAPQVEMSTPESIAGLSVNGTDFVTPGALTEAGQVPQAAAPQLDTPQQAGDFGLAGFTPQFEGQTPSQFMRGEDTPESTTFQGTDFQGRLRQFDSPEARQANIAEGQASFAQASADREARQAARPDFGTAISDRDRRAASGEGISTADRKDMAKANMRGASASDIARGNKVANELGVDLKTGESLESKGGLTFDQQMKLRAQKLSEGKFDYQLSKDQSEAYTAGVEATKTAATDEARSETAGKTMTSAISNMGDAMKRMGGRSGEFFGSGFFGKAASFVPGTSAYDQVADAEFLQSNVALNTMAELKELSPTGSTGFGALSEKELKVLTDKYANLNPFTSPELFQKNLKQLEGEFDKMIDNAWNVHSKEYGEDKANAIYGNRGGGGAPSKAIPNDRNVAGAADSLLNKY